MREPFEPQGYWEDRLARHSDLRGTGQRSFDGRYNGWLYRRQLEVVAAAVDRHVPRLGEARALDVGSGTGAFVELFHGLGVGEVAGCDITETAVAALGRRFPGDRFVRWDVADPPPFAGLFDVVTAMSVLFHVVDHERFARALGHLAGLVAPGGALLVNDVFPREERRTPPHVRFRPLATYRRALAASGLEVAELVPLFYLLNRRFVPLAGARLLSALRAGGLLYRADRLLAARGWRRGAQQRLLVARREAIPEVTPGLGSDRPQTP